MTRAKRLVFWWFLTSMLGVAGSASAQTSTSATIFGRVSDPSHALIADAEVNLRNDETGIAREQMTNSNGQYTFADVAPGGYTITVTRPGFQTATVAGLQLSVNKSYTVDVPLKIGAIETVVEVSTEVRQELQTMDATVGNVIGGKTLLRLPTLTRDASELLSLQPGSTPSPNSGSDPFGIGGGTVSGARNDQNQVMLDGIDITNNNSGGAGSASVVPMGVDNVSEFRVGVSNPNATFGRAGGGQVSVSSNSGTNQVHGDAYWYVQNTAFNANTWDDNHTIDPTTGKTVPRATNRDNRGGFSLGGPLQKNKTFFFANYEVRRFFQSVQAERVVPSQTLRSGMLFFDGVPYNLATSQACGPSGNLACDPRGIGISPTVQALWNLLPQGNDPSIGDGPPGQQNFLGFKFNAPAPRKDDSVSLKLDHNVGPNLHFFGRYQYARDLNPNGTFNFKQIDLTNKRIDSIASTFGDGVIGGMDWVIRGNLVNSIHAGWIRERQNFNSIKPSVLAGQLNLPGTESADGPVSLGPANSNAPFAQLLDTPVDLDGQRARRAKIYSHNIQIRDDLNWTRGRHSFVFGGDVRWLPQVYESDDRLGATRNSISALMDADFTSFLFIPAENRPPDPNGNVILWDRLYAAALGLVDSTSIMAVRDANLNPLPLGTPIQQDANSRAYYFYAQDTWRIGSSVTLSYGLSYGWQTPIKDSQGRIMVLVDHDHGDKPIDSQAYLRDAEAAALNGQIHNPTLAYLPYGKLGMPGSWNTDYGDIAPRLSVAWSPSASKGAWGALLGTNKTVIRGGYGIAFDRVAAGNNVLTTLSGGFSQFLTVGLPSCNATGLGGANCQVDTTPGGSSFRVGVDGQIPVPAADTKQSLPFVPPIFGDSFFTYGFDPNFKIGRNHLVDFSIQRELPKNMLMEVGYIGRLGRDLPAGVNLNQVPYTFKDVTAMSGAAGSGQSFAQAFDAIATALRAGTMPATQPWFEDQVPNTCGVGTSTACWSNGQSGAFMFGAVSSLFTGINSARLNAGLPTFTNLQLSGDVVMRQSHDFSNYNALIATLHNRGWNGLSFDLNYTFSRSLDQEGTTQIFATTYNNSFNPRATYGPSFFDRTHVFNGLFSYDLPLGKGHRVGSHNSFVNHLIGGWYLSGVFRASSGVPIIASETNQAFGGGIFETNNSAAIPLVKPSSLNGGIHHIGAGINYFADPAAALTSFRPILLATDTRSGHSSPLRGFGAWNQDLRIGKETSVAERIKIEFSADLFNVFNHVVFNNPSLDTTNPATFGVVSSQAVPGDRLAGSRWMQLGLRVSF